MSRFVKSAMVGCLLSWAGAAQAQSPFFCMEYPNHGFDCVEHGNIFDASTVLCPDPAEEPWCACLKTYSSDTAPGAKPTMTQEVLYLEDQPTTGTYFADVSRGTLDLSAVSVGDVVFNFIVCVDGSIINQIGVGCEPDCPPFELNFEAIVTAKGASSVDVDLTLPPDTNQNPVNTGVLGYDPVDEMHSFGKTYEGTLASRGAGKGYTFEYHMYEPDPASASPLRGIQDGDLDGPGFTVEALLVLADGEVGLYSNPPCGKVKVDTSIAPKVPIGDVVEKLFEAEFDFGGGDYTVGINGSTTASVGDSVLLTATTNAAEPPSYTWEITSGTGILTDNADGTASVTSIVPGSVTVRLTGVACSTSKTAEITITFGLVGPKFVRGDSNAQGSINISSVIFTLAFLFQGGPTPTCMDAADSNDQGALNISSAIYTIAYLFQGGPAPPLPGPSTANYAPADCGLDPTADTVPGGDLGCLGFPPCP